MDEDKDTIEIEPKKSVIPSILFIIYHLGLIGCIIGIIVNAVAVSESSHQYGSVYAGLMITFVIGMHFFGNLLYKEYGHNSFYRRSGQKISSLFTLLSDQREKGKDKDTKSMSVYDMAVSEERAAIKQKVVGTYECKVNGETYRDVYLENGVVEGYVNGKKDEEEGKWSISKEGELHFIDEDGDIEVYRINKDKSITGIADIRDGKRKDIPKEDQDTFKKIK